DCLPDVGTQRVLADKKGCTPRRAFWHGPGVVETQASIRDGVHVGHVRWCGPTIAEGTHLVDANVVHDDEKNIRRSSNRFGRSPAASAIASSKACKNKGRGKR